MKRILLSTCLLAGLAVAAPVMAQTPPAAPAAPAPAAPAAQAGPQATPESRAEAKAMAELLGIPTAARNLLGSWRAQMIASTQQSSGKSAADSAVIVDEVLMPDFNAAQPELINILVEIWAANFTADELKTLHRFYETPVGTKLLKTQPIISQQSITQSQLWGRREFQSAVKAHAEELRARGLQF